MAAVPALTAAGANASYVTGAAPVTLDAGLSVADATAASLSAATVSISAGFVLGDTLSVGSPQAGIVSQYNAATGVLTLSGAASLAAYETELDSIAYASANATTSSRTVTWSVNDGVNASAPVTSHVSVSRLPPVVTAGASVSYVAGAAPVALDAGLTVADAAAVSLSAATVSISAGFVQGDTLSRRLAPDRHREPVQRRHGGVDFVRRGEPRRLSGGARLHNLRLRQRHDFEPNDPLVRQRRRQRVRSSDQPSCRSAPCQSQPERPRSRPRISCGRTRAVRRRSGK